MLENQSAATEKAASSGATLRHVRVLYSCVPCGRVVVEVYLNWRPSISFYLMQILTNAVFSGRPTARTDHSRGWDSLK